MQKQNNKATEIYERLKVFVIKNQYKNNDEILQQLGKAC